MPIYEYKCPKCGVFEVTQRITESALKKCPTCKSKIERIMSATSFVLKGSGWYATDYASAKAKTDAASDSAPPASTPTSDSGANGSAAANNSGASKDGAGKPAAAKAGGSKTAGESSKTTSDKGAAKAAD
jgi:putative FmdB family regulatory protein